PAGRRTWARELLELVAVAALWRIRRTLPVRAGLRAPGQRQRDLGAIRTGAHLARSVRALWTLLRRERFDPAVVRLAVPVRRDRRGRLAAAGGGARASAPSPDAHAARSGTPPRPQAHARIVRV